MKKRSLILVIALVIFSLMLAACGSNEPAPSKLDELKDKPESNLGNVTPVETEAPSEDKTVTLGRMVGGVYTNSYAGFGVELDTNWTFYTAEELQEIPENLDEALAEIDGASAIPQIMDMQAENVNDLTSMNVLYQQLNMQQRLVFAALSDEDVVVETLKTQDQIIDAYAATGIAVESMEKVTVTFLGEERYAVKTVASIDDVPYYILQLMDYDLGQYSVTLTLGSFMEDNTESLLDLFYPVE